MNPDGHRDSRIAAGTNAKGFVCWLCGRNNHNNVDLNRNFPFLYQRVAERQSAYFCKIIAYNLKVEGYSL